MTNQYGAQVVNPAYPIRLGDSKVEAIMFQKAEILKDKLDVLNSHKEDRETIRKESLSRLLEDEVEINNLLIPFEHPVTGQVAETPFTNMLQQKKLDIEKERRALEADSWKDTSSIMRDILTAWEAYRNTKNRSQLLNNLPRGVN